MHALVVEDETTEQNSLAELIELNGYQATAVGTVEEARQILDTNPPAVAFVDLDLPDGRGLDLLQGLDKQPQTHVVIVTGGSAAHAARHSDAVARATAEALRKGSAHHLSRPFDSAKLRMILRDVAEGHPEGKRLRAPAPASAERLLSHAPAVQAILREVEQIAQSDAPALIVGEPGTGKSLLAELLHEHSPRARQPLLALNCAATSPEALEGELFGHEHGGYSSSGQPAPGYLERAHGGTLVLDEITEMSLALQARLLRALETGRLIRVGGQLPVAVDVRVIATATRPPQEAIAAGRFRQDLFYRLNVVAIQMPPLRMRTEDIELLSRHFLAQLNQTHRSAKSISAATLRELAAHPWPGNVRELKNVVQRAFLLATTAIEPAHVRLDPRIDQSQAPAYLAVRVGQPIADVEKMLITATLEAHQWDKRKTAEILGISLKTLYNRLNAYAAESESTLRQPPRGE